MHAVVEQVANVLFHLINMLFDLLDAWTSGTSHACDLEKRLTLEGVKV